MAHCQRSSGTHLDIGLERGRDLANNKVALQAYAVNGCAGRLKRFDQILQGGGLGT
jgi:hypothetical protein